MFVSDLVLREVRARFAARDAVDAERLLRATALPFLDAPGRDRERDRVHLAIVKHAEGSFERFARTLALASTDWRDVLVASGLAHEDWPDVLRVAGYPVP